MHQAAFQFGNGGQGGQVLGSGLLYIQFRSVAALELLTGYLEALLLNLGVLAGDGDTCLGSAVAELQTHDLGIDQYLERLLVFQRCKKCSVG